jgi:hypothetical protein
MARVLAIPRLGRLGDARCIEGRQGLKLIGDLKQDLLGSRVGRFDGESACPERTQTKTRKGPPLRTD